MSDEKKPFTVSDRRHFTVEGETRSDAPEERPEPEPLPRPEPPEAPPAGQPSVDFASFIVSMGAQAGALLEGIPDVEGGEAQPDLEGARAIISVIEMLRDKTEGRRTPDENQILEAILYDLRMGYVARARAGKA
jgi:hypothetical protein